MSDTAMLIDGVPATSLPASDRGLHYGDGLFETLAVIDARPVLWSEHRARLEEGCRRLGIPVPPPDALDADVAALAEGQGRGVIKVIVTRGSGGRGYRPPAEPVARRVVSRHPWPDYPPQWFERGVRVRVCTTRLGRNPALAGLKHLNRLEQVLARAEWSDPDIAEGLMLDESGHVIEGTMSNVFCVADGVVRTPQLSACGVAGIMRAQLLGLAEQSGLATQEADLSLAALAGADEVFVCNSLIGLWPVRELDGRAMMPGPVSRVLDERLRAKWPL